MGCLLVFQIVYAQTHQSNQEINGTLRQTNNGTILQPIEKRTESEVGKVESGGYINERQKTHPIRSSKQVSEEALRQYLVAKGSPLASEAKILSASPYSSTIIAICTIEEYSCSHNPAGSNNFWGLMSHGKIIHYNSIGQGIDAIDAFLAKAEGNGRTTVESFRGWYCQSECTNWESTVIKTKLELESLN